MSLLEDPEGFLLEKLSKKVLSANTVRDGILAAFLIVLQKKAETEGAIPLLGEWRAAHAEALRRIMGKAFEEMKAPFEYPSPAQLKRVKQVLQKAYDWDRVPDALRQDFELRCESLFKKFDTGFPPL